MGSLHGGRNYTHGFFESNNFFRYLIRSLISVFFVSFGMYYDALDRLLGPQARNQNVIRLIR